MKKLNIAVLSGGEAAEIDISLLSANTIYKHLDDEKYSKYLIILKEGQFYEAGSNLQLDRSDFSLQKVNQKITFDLVYLVIHGAPAENGEIQGYFHLLNLPMTGCDHFVSGLTFNKQATKDFLHRNSIPMANSQVIYKGEEIDLNTLSQMGFPLFVKPNKNGSSFGVTKAQNEEELAAGVNLAFQYDQEVIVEKFIKGREFSNGVFRQNGKLVILPVTEIRTENEFFDYKAKYEQESEEITPASLTKEELQQCQNQSKKLYQLLMCKGVVRFDYILMDGLFYFLEANTIPGMSEESIVPQQLAANGMTISNMLDAIIEEAL
jgi:D-alanine-D-alanine ligase